MGVNNMRGPIVLGNITRNLLRTRHGADVTKTRAVLVCQHELLAESGIFRRTLSTSSARLSDDKKVSDQASLAKKIDPKEAAARKAAEEATKKALEKKRIEDAAAKKKDSEAGGASKIKAEKEKLEGERLKKEQEVAAKKAAKESAEKAKQAEEQRILAEKKRLENRR